MYCMRVLTLKMTCHESTNVTERNFFSHELFLPKLLTVKNQVKFRMKKFGFMFWTCDC
jgi:hypothetical protein